MRVVRISEIESEYCGRMHECFVYLIEVNLNIDQYKCAWIWSKYSKSNHRESNVYINLNVQLIFHFRYTYYSLISKPSKPIEFED